MLFVMIFGCCTCFSIGLRVCKDFWEGTLSKINIWCPLCQLLPKEEVGL
jgi:hypothetical protein